MEELVRVGIRSYIGLLGLGEQERSRRILTDALQVSALVSGGPSARLPGTGDFSAVRPLAGCLVLLTVRSLLATLLVLKTTIFWRKLPQLEELLDCCFRAAACTENGELCEETSGRTADTLRCACTHETGTICGCRRNSALQTRPELSCQSATDTEHPAPCDTPAGEPRLIVQSSNNIPQADLFQGVSGR
jgi:hypothetical protein